VCLDGELMPWSSKARDLIINQYAAVGASAANGLSKSRSALERALARGIAAADIRQQVADREAAIEKYITAYRNYCQETNGITGLVLAPFHILATEGKVHTDRPHPWHLENIRDFCAHNPTHLMVTDHLLVDLQQEESIGAAIDWWSRLTRKGGEGMVVKPLDYISRHQGRMVQPAMKCRGSEYLRIVYGPEYDLGGNLDNLKQRSVKTKRQLALQEFTLGVEALHRFVDQAPLRRIHECVFGVLALESEAVDPRL
jgi:protein phosphatase